MPRIRSVHPHICVSDTMASLSAELERTFTRLWTHCDDAGRCEDRPKIIKAAIYPLHDEITPETLDKELAALTDANLLIRYEVDGRKYIAVTSWDEYQHPQRAKPSVYPPPPGTVDESSATSNGLERERENGVGEGERNASSLFEIFWKQYPTRKGSKGSKKNAETAWKRLSQAKRAAALEALPNYARSADGFPKDAERYLRGEVWEGLVSAPSGPELPKL